MHLYLGTTQIHFSIDYVHNIKHTNLNKYSGVLAILISSSSSICAQNEKTQQKSLFLSKFLQLVLPSRFIISALQTRGMKFESCVHFPGNALERKNEETIWYCIMGSVGSRFWEFDSYQGLQQQSRYLGHCCLDCDYSFSITVCVCVYKQPTSDDTLYEMTCTCVCVSQRDMMICPVFSDPVLSCFPETQWGHFNNCGCQAFESPALCGLLPARQRPANRSGPLPLCHSVPQGLWGLKLC